MGDLSQFLFVFLKIQNCNISILVRNVESSAQNRIKINHEPSLGPAIKIPAPCPVPPTPPPLPLHQCALLFDSSPHFNPSLLRTQDTSSRTHLHTITLPHPWGVPEHT